MTTAEFWHLIERVGRGDCETQALAMEKELRALAPAEIAAFKERFQEQMNRAYTWDLWGAAFVINGGCSDDGFEYFRAWLLMLGRDTLDRALADPEFLLDAAQDPPFECEAVLYVPATVYESLTGKALPPGPAQPNEPAGEPWEEDDLDSRFPRLSEAFG